MIEQRYKCVCMKTEASFIMRERRPDEDIRAYMEVVRRALGDDHIKRSPLCRAGAVEYLKMPLSENKPIGQVEKH